MNDSTRKKNADEKGHPPTQFECQFTRTEGSDSSNHQANATGQGVYKMKKIQRILPHPLTEQDKSFMEFLLAGIRRKHDESIHGQAPVIVRTSQDKPGGDNE